MFSTAAEKIAIFKRAAAFELLGPLELLTRGFFDSLPSVPAANRGRRPIEPSQETFDLGTGLTVFTPADVRRQALESRNESVAQRRLETLRQQISAEEQKL